ncbi:uncharacterized protein TNIN_134351 [Trichonephila inaurata madagascariensis]|uniref:Uncharacterized protein n=1 Tax=Trichonephila inaurata madagascariensis TaxID=2747483 RepID=A0A8X7C4A2_9ARAC|nr:uncharacterized protein TNIN_134351 [Trichonephila inaurata madagascariensis]
MKNATAGRNSHLARLYDMLETKLRAGKLGTLERKIRGFSGVSCRIRADLSTGKLLTGKCVELNFGLAAIHTKLGWTVIGKETGLGSSNDEIVVDSSVQIILSLYVNGISLKELWEIDSLGIRDPIENVSKRKLFDEQLKEFHEE